MKKLRLHGLTALCSRLCLIVLAVCAQTSLGNPSQSVEGLQASSPGDITVLSIEAFSNPAALWGNGVEAVIEKAYRECFRTFIFDGRIITLRIPFAQNNERTAVAGTDLIVVGDGKADPLFIWGEIETILASVDFGVYTRILSDNQDKVIIFDLAQREWSISRDLFDIARMKAAVFRSLPHKPYVLSSGNGLQAADIYNYLYCIGRIGMDCSGFVWHILSGVAKAGGVDLNREFDRLLRAPPGVDPSFYVGTSLFDLDRVEFIQVEDRLDSLKPADVILFRDRDGTMAHSAVIQSVDLDGGVIRYLQSTDEAPYDERGVHDSFIYFDPERTEVSLKDDSLEWSQYRFPPFPGERPSPFSTDGERYRAFPEFGGGKVVRLRAVSRAIERISSANR